MLVERRHLDGLAELHGAAVGRQRAGQHLDQRGLAAAVRADDADAVAAQDAGREILDDRPAVIGLADAFGLDDEHAGSIRLARRDGGGAGRAAVGAPRFAKRVQVGEPLDVALAPRGDAVAQPMLLGDDLAVELVLVALLLGQHLVAPVLEIGEAALDAAGLAAVEPDRAARQVGEEAAVVADHHQRGAAAFELALQPFDGGEVEMVGRLVEQEDVRLRRQHAGERRAARLAAGQMRRVFAAGRARAAPASGGPVRAVVRPEAGRRRRPAWSARRRNRAPARR